MTRHLILHIGLSKTGSSSIQRVLANQRDALREQGVYMPHSPGFANHALLPASLVNDRRSLWGFHPATWEGLSPAGRLARFEAEWRAEMAALPDWATRCVITAEQIGGLLRQDDEAARLGAALAPYFGSVQLIVYLRRQDSHTASAYTQWLRGGVLREPGLPDGGPAAQPELDYGALLDRFARVFGDASICPRIFDRAELVGGDVVEDFLHITGLTLPVLAEAPNKQSNLSLTLGGQALLLAAGRRLAATTGGDAWRDTPQWRRLAEAVNERLPGRGWRPTRAEAEAFMAAFAATNEHARARFLPHRASLFSQDFSDLPEHPVLPQPDMLSEAALDVLLHEVANGAQREARAAMAQFQLLKKLGDRPMMRTVLIRAVKFAPDLLPPRLRLTELLLEDGDLLQAAEHAAAAARIAPDDPKVVRLNKRVAQSRQAPLIPSRQAATDTNRPEAGGTSRPAVVS
jgi:hypothetical protein